jgi:hypothetical protein
MRHASRFQHYFALKNEIFNSTDLAFYKNAQIFTKERFALTLFLLIDLFYDNRGTVRAFDFLQLIF